MNPVFKSVKHLGKSLKDLMAAAPAYRWGAMFSFALVVATFLLPIWRILPQSGEKPFVPLHYNIYVGVDQFGPWYNMFILPSLGLALLVVNILFEAAFFRREHVLSHFFAIATVFAELALFVAMVLIVLLNL